MAKKVHCLIIDPQNSFCVADGPITDEAKKTRYHGTLVVPGALADMERLAKMINRVRTKLADIHVTLDSHHLVDVAHPIFWRDNKGSHPGPFTIISAKDVETGVWSPVVVSLYKRMLAYVQGLEKNGRYPLCIWPPHCLIGTWGHNVVDCLSDALLEFESEEFAVIDYVTKGSNIYTEHYSAVVADVPDPEDPGTQLNTRLVDTIMEADIIAVAGEAGSHCLRHTVTDIANAFGDDKYIQRIVLLTDATSPVPGFEKQQADFIKEMTARGMQLSTTVDFLS
jgi:nicotinamidase-related amidase